MLVENSFWRFHWFIACAYCASIVMFTYFFGAGHFEQFKMLLYGKYISFKQANVIATAIIFIVLRKALNRIMHPSSLRTLKKIRVLLLLIIYQADLYKCGSLNMRSLKQKTDPQVSKSYCNFSQASRLFQKIIVFLTRSYALAT